jgi:predicted amidohydrolase
VKYLAAAAQMRSGADRAANRDAAVRLVDEAAARGAQLVALPENAAFMGPEKDKVEGAETLDGPFLTALRERARAHGVHLLAGSFQEKSGVAGRVHNTSVLIGPDGATLAVYRKLHLFDVDLPDGARYRESETVAPGSEVVAAETPLGTMGLSVCYDLRFPELYRALSQRGAQLLFVPAAFTEYTGRAHWEVLLRARAVENLCYLVAPAQQGRHSERRTTWGHAMIVDPWGEVLAERPEGEGLALAEIDLARVAEVRRELPALAHRKM